jgi:hypothetical protein
LAASLDASLSSSSNMVGGLMANYLRCSAVAFNIFSRSFSTSSYCSFIQLVKPFFIFWYCLSLFSF